MCGIFAYTGTKDAGPLLLDGLTSLEYRGYDSAGIFLPESGAFKAVGAVANLREKIKGPLKGESGIAHLRWATHGEPTETNAHPHSGNGEDVWVVHNGIIENYKELKARLEKKGHTFKSVTDTEVIAHLLEEHIKIEKDFEKAALKTLNELRGTYGIAMQYKGEPGKVIGARMGAPVVLGVGEGENFIASDASPILKHTKSIVFLNDGEVAVITPDQHKILSLAAEKVHREPEEVDWSAEDAQKGGHEHFMLKEMMEGPDVLRDTLRGRLLAREGAAKLGGLESVKDRLAEIERIIIVACGTAYHAGLVGEHMLEGFAKIPVEVELASEFRYRKPVINGKTAVLAVSQSGETADTLEAIREAKRQGAMTLGIVNTVGSTIARETDAGVYNHAGPEIGVASTKAFISQLEVLALLTIFLGRRRSMSAEEGKKIAEELQRVPEKIEHILEKRGEIEALAQKYLGARDFLFVGRTINTPVAMEGALKLKELSYIHAEGTSAGEMKHGPIAMIDENFPTFAIASKSAVYEKVLSNMQEIKARKGPILAVATEGDEGIRDLADDVIYVPETIEMLSPIVNTPPLHLFAYYFAKALGYNPDRPRNLAKSVTVE